MPKPGRVEGVIASEGDPKVSARGTTLACLIFASVTLLFFAPVFAGRTSSTVPGHQTAIWPWRATPTGYADAFPQSDQADTFHPWQVFIGRTVRSGSLPLWNRHSFGGSPFLVNGQNSALYPPRFLLSLTVPASWVHDLLLLSHMFFAGVAAYILLRQLDCGLAGAVFGASAWMLNSHVLAWMQLEFIGPVAVFLPLAVAALVRFQEDLSPVAAVACGGALAMMMLGSQVQLAVLLWLAVAVYAASLLVRPALNVVGRRGAFDTARRPALVRRILLTSGIFVTAAGLSAAALVPTLLAAGEVARLPFAYATLVDQFAMPLRAYGEALWPPGLPLTQAKLLSMTFIGAPTVAFALVGCLRIRRGMGLGLACALLTVLITVGTPLTRLIYTVVPGFGHFRPLGRLAVLFGFGVVVLAALGMDAALRWGRDLRARSTPFGRAAPVAFIVVALGSFFVTTGQLFWYGRQINPPFPPRRASHLYPPTGLIRALETDSRAHPASEPQRFIPVGRSEVPGEWSPPVLYASQAMIFGLDSAAGYESILPERTADLWRVVEGNSPEKVLGAPLSSAYITSFRAGSTRLDLLPRLGVTTIAGAPDLDSDPAWQASGLQLRRLYSGPDGQVLDVAGRQDAAWVAFTSERVSSRAQGLRRISDPAFDFRRVVLLEGDARQRSDVTSREGAASVISVRRGTNSVSVDVRSTRPGWLVMADSWAPGWRARVGGEPAKVLRANYSFRAVLIPSGLSEVTLTYRPPGFAFGALVSLGTTVGVVAALGAAVGRKGRRRAGSGA